MRTLFIQIYSKLCGTAKKHWLLQKGFPVKIQPGAYISDFQENGPFNQSIIFFVTSEMVKVIMEKCWFFPTIRYSLFAEWLRDSINFLNVM
jgi:hypothetical protein